MIPSRPRQARQRRPLFALAASWLFLLPLLAFASAPSAAAPSPLANAAQIAFFDDFETGALDPDGWVTPTAWGPERARLQPWLSTDLPLNDTSTFHLSDSRYPQPGRYANASRSAIETSWIDLTEATFTAGLTLFQRYDIDLGEDGALVLIRTEGGGWGVLAPDTGYPTPNGFAGISPSFEGVHFDLTPFGGARIKLAFQLLAGDNGVTGDGWQIESVAVSFSSSVPRPDLQLSEVAIYNSGGGRIASGVAGDVLDLRANITNAGTASTTLSVPVVFFDGPATTGRPLGQGILPAVSPGTSAWVSLAAVLAAGPHNITAVVDPAGLVAEFSRANNQARSALQLTPAPGADLAVLEVAYELAGVRTNGARPLQTVTANITVANLGGVAVGGTFVVGVYLDDGANVSAIDERSLGGGFLAGEVRTVLISFTVNEGNLTLLASVDRGGAIPEASEANNELRTVFPVTPDPPVDLTVSSVVALVSGGQATESTEGDLVLVRAFVRNAGTGDLVGAFTVGFFLGDPDAGGGPLFTRSVSGGLPANTTIEVHGSWSAEIGQRTLYAKADVTGIIFEASELNNKAMASLHVSADTRANLVVDAIRFKVLGSEVNATQVGAPVSVEVVVRNVGTNATISGQAAVSAANPWVSPLTAGVTRSSLPSQIPKNAQAVVNFTWVAVAGVRVFYAAADVDMATGETNEFDNVLIRTLRVSPDSPDLVVGSVSVKSKGVEASTLYPGLNVTISAEVTNNGVAPSGSFVIEVWAGEPGALGSVRLNSTTVAGPFGPGDSAQVKVVWLASFASGGSKPLVVVADPRGAVIEADRSNNVGSKEVTYGIARLPNLVADWFTSTADGLVMSEVQEGAALVLSIGVKNDSPAPYLGGGVLEVRDAGTVVFTAPLPRIEPGQTIRYDANWTARPGSQVVVTLDSLGQVDESDEGDNQQSLFIVVKAKPQTPWTLIGGGAGAAAAAAIVGLIMMRKRRRPAAEEAGAGPAEGEIARPLEQPLPVTEPPAPDPAAVSPELASSVGSATVEAGATVGPEFATPFATGAIAAAPTDASGPDMHAMTASADAAAGEVTQPEQAHTPLTCPSCAAPVEPGWVLCPNCEATLSPQ